METKALTLEDSVKGIGPALRAVFLVVMPDCLAYEHWVQPGDPLRESDVGHVSAHFGYLMKSNKEALREMRYLSEDMVLTVESAGALLMIKEIDANFVVSFVFDSRATLGMVRMHVKHAVERIRALLPTFRPEERPRILRVLDLYRNTAVDPATALPRLALQSRIAPNLLEAPENLGQEQQDALEQTVARLLGMPYPLSV